jgi:hypothetical protein
MMDRFRAVRLAGVRRTAALLILALAACGDGVTDGNPGGGSGRPGGGTPPPDTASVVTTIDIEPGTLQLRVDSSRALSATVRNQRGDVLAGRLPSWTSSDPTVVRVDYNGNTTALKVGSVVVTASLEGREGRTVVEVLPPPSVASVQVTGDVAGLEPDEARQLSALMRAANGTILDGRQITWSSSDSTVVRVRPDGQITGVKGGTATITATSEGVSGSLTIIIPQWLQFDLKTVFSQALPVVIDTYADTTDVTEFSMTITTYRSRLVWGRLWLSTVDWRYRQRYDLQLWKQKTTWFNGSAIATPEELVQTQTIRDEGVVEQWDLWTGEPIYASGLFGGHTFRVYRLADGTRLISQRIPGATEASFDLRFRK